MAEKIGEAYVDITARLDEYEKQLKDAQKQLSSFSTFQKQQSKSMIAGFAKLAGGVVGVTAALSGLKTVYSKSIKAASDLEETNNKFAVTFKSVSKNAENAAKVLQKSFGLSIRESKQLLSNTGDLLTGFGLSGQEALNLSSNLNQLAVDLASFTNIEGGAERASRALTSALLGEREQAKQLGIVIRENDIQARLAAKGQDKLTGNALLQAKAFATLEIATEQSKNAIGDYERSQDSFANTSRRLLSTLEDVSAEIGSELLPDFSMLMSTLSNSQVVLPAITGMFKLLGSVIGGFARAISYAIQGIEDVGKAIKAKNRIGELKDAELAVASLEKKVDTARRTTGKSSIEYKAWSQSLDGAKIKLAELRIEQAKFEKEGLSKYIDTLNDRTIKYEQNILRAARGEIARLDIQQAFAKENAKDLVLAKNRMAVLNDTIKVNERLIQSEADTGNINANTFAINNNTGAKKKNAEATKEQISALEIYNNMTSVATQLTSGLGDIFQLQAENRLTELENEKQQQLDKIAADYETEQQQIEQTISNEEEKNAALKALDEKRARDEKTIEEKIDKDKRKIQRQAAKDQKALKIAETIIAGASASINAYNSLAVIPIIGPALGAAAAAAVAALTAVKVGLIQATPLPALAQGGIATAPTTALIGEAGSEAVFPLEGPQGQKTRAMFANDLITAIANQQEQFLSTSTIDSATAGQPMRLTVNIGSKNLYDDITTATQNKEILIDSGAIIES